MADMSQAQARAAAIAAGHPAEEVDAFIAKEGGARTSAQRITSAFGVAGSSGTDDLTAYHAQKATAAGTDASGTGTYLPGTDPSSGRGFVPPGGGGGSGSTGSVTGLDTVLNPSAGGSGTPPSVQALGAGDGGDTSGGLIGGAMGSLRPLGQRMPPQDSMALASLGRRVY